MEELEKEAKEKGIDINNEVKEFEFLKNQERQEKNKKDKTL